uniref:Uncharacterized protein n=1 Tax=Knipowitschia caucasica TaxID=637954 RepID=A0AAV2LLZ0_KNICA
MGGRVAWVPDWGCFGWVVRVGGVALRRGGVVIARLSGRWDGWGFGGGRWGLLLVPAGGRGWVISPGPPGCAGEVGWGGGGFVWGSGFGGPDVLTVFLRWGRGGRRVMGEKGSVRGMGGGGLLRCFVSGHVWGGDGVYGDRFDGRGVSLFSWADGCGWVWYGGPAWVVGDCFPFVLLFWSELVSLFLVVLVVWPLFVELGLAGGSCV